MAHCTPHQVDDYFPLVTGHTNGGNNNSDTRNERPKPKRKSIWERVDLISFITIFLGSALLLLVLLLLAYFWKLSMMADTNVTEEPNANWAHIINASWGTRLVTICATIIGTVVTFQASLATAMVAGILMETTGIPLLHGPFYSIVRALQVSPSNLLTSVNFWPHNLLSSFIYILVISEVLVTIASQFLSTVLLSDFADGTFIQMNSTPVSILNSLTLGSNALWKIPPAASWTFAELSEPFIEGPNFHDTGHTYRAPIPLWLELQRKRLRKFHGPVSVIDQRVFCASPTLINLSLEAEVISDVRLSGQISIDSASYPALRGTGPQSYVNFTCQLQQPVLYVPDTPGVDASICFANSGLNWPVQLKDPLAGFITDDEAGPLSSGTKMFMILDILSIYAIRNAVGANHLLQTVRNDGPWAIITNGSDVEAIGVSACMTNLDSLTVVADMRSLSDNLEPAMLWDPQAQSYNSENVRRQLGASTAQESSKDRGVLTLGPQSQWQTVKNNTWSFRFFEYSLISSLASPLVKFSSALKRSADPGVAFSKSLYSDSWSAHPIHTSVFIDTLNDTKSPALALQAVLARICQMAYYEELVKQNTTAVASTLMASSASIPMRWTGFTIGTAIIVAHLIIVTILAAMFIKYTHYSCIGSYWQAISQVISEDTRPVLKQADKMKDDEVKVWAKQQSLDVKNLAFLRYRQDGRVSLGILEHCER